MIAVNIHEATMQRFKLVDQAATGEGVVRIGEAVAAEQLGRVDDAIGP